MKKWIFVLPILLFLCADAEGRRVKGSVRCGTEPLEGVVVTDGRNFTLTQRNGKFVFDISDDAEFVYITTPAGYVADWSSGVPAFYIPAPGRNRFDFQLNRTQESSQYHIIAVSDPQTHSDAHFAEFSARPLEDMALTAASFEGFGVGLMLGDISWDRIEILDMYKKEIVRAGIPFYPVVGNHDNEAYVKGDKEASASYRKKMGPENYAFRMGEEVVIVLDNIIYDTNFKCSIGYTDEVIGWVEGLLKFLPADAGLYIAQHAPLTHGNKMIINGDRLLELVRGRKVSFLSGHTHVNGNHLIEKDIRDHNVGAICGAWWDTKHCTDGTPRGYKVFTMAGDSLSWYYKPVEFGRDHIAEVFPVGGTPEYPDAVVTNVWDWDPDWKVEWYEDGVYKGAMKQISSVSAVFTSEIEAAYRAQGQEIPRWKRGRPSPHNFAAVPSPSARSITVTVESPFGQKWSRTIAL